ncbi:MAG TPA: hypothetical protein VEV84_03945 [Pyrinomonadaceae bacterium]|jgi:hypothetical protein|nr:hypothetical protein [Pyrinomonadaceae bacterium]
MGKCFLYVTTLLIFAAFAPAFASAQITISIPNLPKVKKPKPTTDSSQTGNNGNTSNTSTSGNNSQTSNTSTSKGCDQYSFVYGVFLDDIKKKQEEAAAYTGPQDKIYYVSETQDDYIKLAVSKSRRDKWFADKKMNDYRADAACNKLDPALDELATIVAKTIPLYVPEQGKYAIHNAAEEALMKSKVTDIADLKVFRIGLASANWNIEKNDIGIPTDRYKYGLIYAKPLKTDDPYCRMIFVNIVQDYAGGGTYGASYGNFIKSEIAGCPAGN